VHDAVCDPAAVRLLWTRWPTANVGVATGSASGLVVLDVDPRNGGEEGLHELEARIGALPATPVVLTGGSGTHHYFGHPGSAVSNRRNLAGFPGVDLKADGGYVVAPPSNHLSGYAYQWDVEFHPDEVPIARCPDALIHLAADGAILNRISYEPRPWDGTLPGRVLQLLETGPRLIRNRFERCNDRLRDPSPSGIDASLATLLALNGLPGHEIESALRASRARYGLPTRRDSYFRATVAAALAWARERERCHREVETLILKEFASE